MSDEKDPAPMPSIPLRDMIEASRDLPKPFQSAVLLLCTKIDKGFSSTYFFMRNHNRESRATEEKIKLLANRVEALEAKLSAKDKEDVAEDNAKTLAHHKREITARHKLEKVELEREMDKLTEKRVAEAIQAKEVADEVKAEKLRRRKDRLLKMVWAGMGAAVLYGLKLLAQAMGLE